MAMVQRSGRRLLLMYLLLPQQGFLLIVTVLSWLASTQCSIVPSGSSSSGALAWWSDEALQLGRDINRLHYSVDHVATAPQADHDILWPIIYGSATVWESTDPNLFDGIRRNDHPSIRPSSLPENDRKWTRPPIVETGYGPPPPPKPTLAPSAKSTTPAPNRGTEVEDTEVIEPPRYKPKKEEPLQIGAKFLPPWDFHAFSLSSPKHNVQSVPGFSTITGLEWPHYRAITSRSTGYVPARKGPIDEWPKSNMDDNVKSFDSIGVSNEGTGSHWIKST